MASSHIILETHIFSSPTTAPGWSRSFHLRLPSATATKADILTLVRDSYTRLGRSDPVVEAQITLSFTRNGRVASLPGTATTTNTTLTVPVSQTPQLVYINTPYIVQQQQQQQGPPEWPLAMTYSGGVNYLHSYGPGSPAPTGQVVYSTQQAIVVGGGQTLVNVNMSTAVPGGGRPVVSDVVREVRLDGIAEEALVGLLEWAVGPTGLKLIVLVDVDGRDVVPAVLSLPQTPPAAEPTSTSAPAL